MNLLYKIKYYFWASYRRKYLDYLQNKYKNYYHGTVFDIGGRDRGIFQKPKAQVEKWIFADIEPKHKPDIVLNVEDMKKIQTESIDMVNAIELFEHVQKPELGLKECCRVLKINGAMFISCPFISPIHADPYDFQRWTEYKWKKEFKYLGLSILNFEICGLFYTTIGDMVKNLITSMPMILRYVGYLLYPVIDVLVWLDNLEVVKNNSKLNKYHAGYFFVLKKLNHE